MRHKIFLLHAYAAGNSGDRLLVECSIEIAKQFSTEPVTVVCIDKYSFLHQNHNLPARYISIPQFFLELLKTRMAGVSPIFFGVGGGYLRFTSVKEGIKTFLAHSSQLLLSLAIHPTSKFIYLPQSVGPFTGVLGKITKLLLKRIDILFVRDEKSLKEITSSSNVVRCPDLVVRKIFTSIASHDYRRTKASDSLGSDVGFIFRDLPASKSYSYRAKISTLFDTTPNAKLLIQSKGRGNNDEALYCEMFPGKPIIERQDFERNGSGVIVSVRLHGSLEAILAGVPSVHLAYERKGLSAFSDLGIGQFAFHVRDFDPPSVQRACETIRLTPNAYWSKIEDKAKTFTDNIPPLITKIIEAK
ncbi:polysaccharide pyruvyl transferase family protein [Hydrogenophaga sp.]|uniref:polysaccharide pyruvyl transferase family protein n=1 Tax=Hydrogenophaga sp. TaxID=1904254 RepID=UPI0035B4405B